MDPLDHAIREFTPKDGAWLPLEKHIEMAFQSPDPRVYYHALFSLFERFPEDDGAGALWSALHGMEAVGDYESLLLVYFHRCPSLMTTTMIRRMYKPGRTHIGQVELAKLIKIGLT